MSTVKIAISINQRTLKELDDMVLKKVFPNRSRAIQSAIEEKINRMNHSRLAEECSKLDVKYEQSLAGEGIAGDFEEWPEY